MNEAIRLDPQDADAYVIRALSYTYLDRDLEALNWPTRRLPKDWLPNKISMPGGQIMESGPPEELIRRGGRFAALLELEAAGWDWQTDGPFEKLNGG